PNSVVKRFSADGSVGLPHVRVGHRQALIIEEPSANAGGFFYACLLVANDANHAFVSDNSLISSQRLTGYFSRV
ncbi:hypothetical protein J6I90_12330, partial [Pseudidiomarina sp. 1APP75-32.1]